MKAFFKKTLKFVKAHPWLDFLFLALGLAIFLTIALINAPRASIWFDEAYSAYISQFSFADIARYTATDVHPPVYYWLLKIWSSLFGTTDLAYRSLSVLFGAGALTSAFFLARRLFGRAVSVVTLLLLIASPMLIRYSDEARMYTLSALIVLLATQVLVKATQSNQKRWWVIYGVLVSLGMWTHYFTAFAWLAHWGWRASQTWQKGNTFKVFWKKFFSKEWILAYGVAVGLFLPWIMTMIHQLGIVQGNGFWISPVGIDTPTNLFTNIFYYLEHDETTGIWALLLLLVGILLAVLVPRVQKALLPEQKKWFGLVMILSFIPPALLFLASLPPLRSSFVERYLMPSIVAFSIFMAVTLVVGTRRWLTAFRVIPIIVILGMMIFGVSNVYYYGNFNKNSGVHILARQLVEQIRKVSPTNEPIVASTPWVFYETVPYTTSQHSVYFIDQNTQYVYGSLTMLQDRDQHKIKDLSTFSKQHAVIWYVGSTYSPDVNPYLPSWQKIRTIGIQDDITGDTLYKATEYRINQ